MATAPQYLSTDPNAGAPQYLSTDPNAGAPPASNGGTPITDTSTIGPAPQPSLLERAGSALHTAAQIPINPLGIAGDWAQSPTEGGPETFTSRAKELTRMVLPEIETLGGSIAPAEPLADIGEGVQATRAAKAAEVAESSKTEAAEEGNRLLKTKPKDFRNEVVPGRAIVRESVNPETVESANNARLSKDTVAERQHLQSVHDHLQNSISNLKEQQAVLLKHPTGEGFDVHPIVEQSYQKALAEAKQTGSPEIVKAVNKAREEMLKIPNDDGELIADRYLNFEGDEGLREGATGRTSAEEAHEVKKTFQGRSNYNPTGGNKPDTATQYANNFWKDVAAKVRLRLEDQVPGLGDVNSRIRDANAATRLAEKRIDTLRGMPALPSRMDRFLKAAKPALIKGAVGGLGAGAAYNLYKDFLAGE